jgi:hypothetical protein
MKEYIDEEKKENYTLFVCEKIAKLLMNSSNFSINISC